jgi:hypothetical protein
MLPNHSKEFFNGRTGRYILHSQTTFQSKVKIIKIDTDAFQEMIKSPNKSLCLIRLVLPHKGFCHKEVDGDDVDKHVRQSLTNQFPPDKKHN